MKIINDVRAWVSRLGQAAQPKIQGIQTMLSTPIVGAGGLVDSTPAMITAITTIDDAERLRQKDVLAARAFHEGRNTVRLTDRLKEFLGKDEDVVSVSLNVASIVCMALSERLEIAGFDCDAENEAEKTRQIEFAQSVWDGSRMKAKQADLWEETMVDGEHFVLVSWDDENARPKFTPQPRYTDARVDADGESGDGDGMRLFYRNNDTSDKPEYAVKRWVERWFDERGHPKSEQRITIYKADRIEKYHLTSRGWQPFYEYDFTEGGEPIARTWPIAWVNESGEPLGIPVVHCKTPRLRPEAKKSWGSQKAISKTLIDLLTASDMTAFRLVMTYGWKLEDAAGNPLQFAPGSNLGTMNENARSEIIDGASLQDIRETIDKLILWVAGVTDTPASRFVMSGAVRAEGTLQEEKESLIAKVERRANILEMAVEDALKIARRLHNTFGDGEALSEESEFTVLWKPFSQKNSADKAAEASALLASGVAEEIVQRTVWHLSEEDIARSSEMLRGDGFPAVAP